MCPCRNIEVLRASYSDLNQKVASLQKTIKESSQIHADHLANTNKLHLERLTTVQDKLNMESNQLKENHREEIANLKKRQQGELNKLQQQLVSLSFLLSYFLYLLLGQLVILFSRSLKVVGLVGARINVSTSYSQRWTTKTSIRIQVLTTASPTLYPIPVEHKRVFFLS